MRIYRLSEARNKERFFKTHSKLTPEQKEELIRLYSEQYVPDSIIDWNKIESYSYDELYNIVDTFIKDREEKKNKKNLSKAIEGRDYLKIFENKNSSGTEYLYLPLTWIGSKYLASDHFLPKIKVPSKVMQARDFSDTSAKNDDLSPGAKWCISLWTIPDLVLDNNPFTDGNGKELRHEGKRYWLDYTSGGYYFLFYFRDFINLDDIHKKIALTLRQGSSKIEDITLADDTRGGITSALERIQKYWDDHYQEYISQIDHIQEVSKEDKPEFRNYEEQKEQEARGYLKSHIMDYFTYNESTGRYDNKIKLNNDITGYLVKYGEFTIPLGVITGNFNCSSLSLETLKNGPTEVTGNFNCSENYLTTLEYAPKRVGGGFYCSDNQLTSLEYAPQEVKGTFDCSSNKLTTLKYAPKYVEGTFKCSWNKLTTLEYAPEKVGGDFYCHYNDLQTLEGAPEEVGGDFVCFWCKLSNLKGAPQKIGGSFHCSNSNLKTLEGAPQEVGRDFICTNNNLETLKGAPKEVGGDFKCSGNNLKTLEGAPKKVGGDFGCSNNQLKTLEGSPIEVIGSFNCSHNNLKTLEGAPKMVGGEFYCWSNPLRSRELSTDVRGEIKY